MFRFKFRPALLTAIGALAIGATIATPAFATPATDAVTQEITGGTLTASITAATLTSVTYSNSVQTNPGTLTLNVSDARGTSEGWNVTVASSDFVYTTGPSVNPSDIPATGFSVVTPATPVMVAGQAVDNTNGPKAGASGALSAPRKVISSEADYGSGDYTQSLPVSLQIPARSQTGTYVATLTVVISSGP